MQHDPVKAKIIELADLRDRSDHCSWCECMDDREFTYSITLADVLRAINKGWDRDYTEFVVHEDGEMIVMHIMDDGSDERGDSVQWNLTADYDGQTQEVKDFIGSLLDR